MHIKCSTPAPSFYKPCFIALVTSILMATPVTGSTQNQAQESPAPYPEFVMTGACPSGDNYRLHFYSRATDGEFKTYYAYDGPNGQGVVQSLTEPTVMAARVCRKLAEIINVRYWD
jgi:hypothetical protein